MGIEDYGGGQTPQADVLVVTTNDAPGHEVTQVIGEVFGLTVRSLSEAADVGTEVCAHGTAAVINRSTDDQS
ncbi:hypothetical protein [Streptomyces sp. NPDC048565]|uniref:heavy metal-binding domain-containing protein n=1 Tax=Streptomyces sp. NPDC048565 TaxID=3155266 RepID=UPI003432869F